MSRSFLKDLSKQKDPDQFYKEMELEVLARTIYGEAKEYDVDVKKAIANVIQNRARIAKEQGKYWWGNNIIQICQKPYQFSCWNRSDPRFKRLSEISRSDFVYDYCVRLAEDVQENRLPDKTLGATHYHHITVLPYWTKGEQPCVIKHPLAFYNLGEK